MKLSKDDGNMTNNSEKRLNAIFNYVVNHTYPEKTSKNDKANIRRLSKSYLGRNGRLYYKHSPIRHDRTEVSELLVILEPVERERIIEAIHLGSGDSDQAKCMGGHMGRDKTLAKIMERYYWKGVSYDVAKFVSTCEKCQAVNPCHKKEHGELHPVPVPKQTMAHIGIDLAFLPETPDGYTIIATAVDYFSKWIEARALKTKSAIEVAAFLLEDIVCRHGCVSIQINDQGREFVNAVSTELHRLCGTEQRITSAYHPQANGLVERQNRTTKDCLLKCLEEKHNWAQSLAPTLFAYRTSKHASTGFSPFRMLYTRDAKLPIDVELDRESPTSVSEEVHENEVQKRARQMEEVQRKMYEKAHCNISNAQQRQKKGYDKRRLSANTFHIDTKVFHKNLVRTDRKGGKFVPRWNGPYTIVECVGQNNYKLKNKHGKCLRQNVNGKHLKQWEERMTPSCEKPSSNTTTDKEELLPEIIDSDSQTTLEYMPVCNDWQKQTCKNLGLELVCGHHIHRSEPKIIHRTQAPLSVGRIVGDGNCVFRAISRIVTGSQDNHGLIRAIPTQFMKENSGILSSTLKATDGGMDSYLEKSGMEKLGVWGTEVELFAMANIITFAKYGACYKWLKFTPQCEAAGDEHSSEGIYLLNQNDHFEDVRRI